VVYLNGSGVGSSLPRTALPVSLGTESTTSSGWRFQGWNCDSGRW
jgi:hypothetical protein